MIEQKKSQKELLMPMSLCFHESSEILHQYLFG